MARERSARRLLEKTNRFLTPKTWTKYHYRFTTVYGTRFCLLGALERTASRVKAPGVVYVRAVLYLREALGHSNIVKFNDSPRTTLQNVKAVIRGAIKKISRYSH